MELAELLSGLLLESLVDDVEEVCAVFCGLLPAVVCELEGAVEDTTTVFADELEVLVLSESELEVVVGDNWSLLSAATTLKPELEAKIWSGCCLSDIGCRLEITSIMKDPVCVGVKLNGILEPCSDWKVLIVLPPFCWTNLRIRLNEVGSPLFRFKVAEEAVFTVADDGKPVKLKPAATAPKERKTKVEKRILGRLYLQRPEKGLF